MYKRLIFILLIFMFLFIPKEVLASPFCTNSIKSDLVAKVYNIQISYDIVKLEEGVRKFSVKILNLDPSFRVVMGDYELINTDNKQQTLYPEYLDGGETYKMKVYVIDGVVCQNEYLATKTIKLPKYNIYSENDLCIEYEEFPLCHKYYDGEIKDLDDFQNRLNEYIEGIKEIPEYKDERTIWDKLIEIYIDNIEISVTITVFIILLIIAIIIRKIYRWATRQKIKFNIDENMNYEGR